MTHFLTAAALSVAILFSAPAPVLAQPVAGERLPFDTVSLLESGAVGDDMTDDTEALRSAFKKGARGLCLDGGNKVFRVTGTLRADGNLCLVNTRLKQMIEPVDTLPYIKSTGREPPIMSAAEPARFYPEDPVLSDNEHRELELRNNLRTIFVTGRRSGVVYLRNVQVSRGDFETLGTASNAAGIWVTDSPSVRMFNVEVFGSGRGHGVFVTGSQNIELSQLNIHDLRWSSDRGDRAFTLAQMRNLYEWNNVPLYIYDQKARRFGVLRSQEQTNGLVILNSENISLTNSQIARVLYNARGVYIPWQADGITMGHDRNVEISHLNVEEVWEGIDFTGMEGVESFHLSDLTIKDIFGFGLKLVHATNSGSVDRVNISYSGLNGIVVSDSANNIEINHATIRETGVLYLPNGTLLSPYIEAGVFRQNIAGIGITANKADPANNPKRIHIDNSTARNLENPNLMRFGLSSDVTESDQVVIENFEASGYKWKAIGNQRLARELERAH